MLKALFISQVIFTCLAAWYDKLDEGSIEGYLNQGEIMEFITGLDSSNGFELVPNGKQTVNDEEVRVFYRESST